MNKRQKKKFKKKLKCKTYKYFGIMETIERCHKVYGEDSIFFPYIVTDADGKYIKHAYIMQMRSANTNKL